MHRNSIIEPSDWTAVFTCNFNACCSTEEETRVSKYPPKRYDAYGRQVTTNTETREYINERYEEHILKSTSRNSTHSYSEDQLIGPGYRRPKNENDSNRKSNQSTS